MLGRTIRRITAFAFASMAIDEGAFGCATCYTDALGSKGLHAIQSGILILLLPTIAIFAALMLLTFRYRNSCPSWRRPVTKTLRPSFSRDALLPLEADPADR